MLSALHEWICGEATPAVLQPGWRNESSLPHFTECVQHLELSWIPLLLLAVMCVLLVLDVSVSLFYNGWRWMENEPNAAPYFHGDIVQYIGLCSALTLTIACRNRGVVSSGVLFIYWLATVICGFPEMRYLLTGQETVSATRFWLYMAYYPLVCLQLLLSCFADTPTISYGGKNVCPELTSSFLNQITFNWFTGLAIKGNRKPLDREDLWDLNERDRGHTLIPDFNANFRPAVKEYQLRRKLASPDAPLNEKQFPSILGPIFKTYKLTFLSGFAFKLVFDLLTFVAPQLLKHLITFIQDRSQPMWIGVAIALLMFIIALIQSMVLHQYFHNMFRLGMNIRSVLTSAVYAKAMNLSNNARKNRTIGEIVNLMTVDIQRFQDMTTFIMLFWSAPLQVCLSIYFLWRLLGVAVIAGLVILVAMVPFNSFISVKMRNCQVEQMRYKDERLKLMSEILNGVKVLKLYAWEKSMQKMVSDIRGKEIAVLKKLAFLNAATTLSWACAPFLVAVITFGVYVTMDPENNVLTPQITFVALALFNILRFPLAIFAMIFSQAIQCVVSNKRLRAFFAEEEMDDTAVEYRSGGYDQCITIKEGAFSWENSDSPCLNNINLDVNRGQLVAVVGRVGSGKSSLLSAILGEMNKAAGKVNVSGRIAYVPQQAWIQNLTLRENILFNKPLDREHYETVIDSCALRTDFASLPTEDMTEIGEKGINLSGGQKQRVSLARAVYSNCDVVLLDDPLSAVDSHVGKHIFENVISSQTGILKNATRVLVTHGLHFLKYCDKVVVLKDGTISEMGTYRDLIRSQGAFSEFLEEFLVQEAKNRGRSVSFGEDSEEVGELLNEIEKADPAKRHRIESQLSQASRHSSEESIDRTEPPIDPPSLQLPSPKPLARQQQNGASAPPEVTVLPGKEGEKTALLGGEKEAEKKSKIISKEIVETGKVAWSVYLTYMRSIGFQIAVLFVAVYIFSSILGVMSNLWLASWSDDAKNIQLSGNGSSYETNRRLLVYTGLGLGQAIFVCAASVIMALGMVRASRILHEGMLRNTLHSPMSFFDVTPLGRILNRFGKDVEVIDARLPGAVLTFIGCVIQTAMILVVPIYATPHVLFALLPVAVFYCYLLDVDCVDGAIPRSVISFFRMVVSSFEIVIVIVWATPVFSLILLPLFIVYANILRFYVSTSRQLKRLESTTRSPIYSHFQESVQGASSIRAYNCVDRFVMESQRRVDENLATYYPSIVANRWLAVRLELVGNLIVLFSALFAALFRDSPGLSAGLVGLSVSYALNITQTLNWAVRMTSELETNIVAVERLKEYTETPIEGRPPANRPSHDWPKEGRIVFRDLTFKYRQGLDPVLKGISAEIRPNEKVGIVGRTGAGKSSLTLALFRIVEAEGGSIEIDGENIANLNLADLRSRLTIVPQDPVLFSGTLRINLDPFEAFEDDAIWTALRNAHLESFVASLPDRLSHTISEGGDNLSVGQRQLICLARALLRKTKVLILDEAAAAVDVETDTLLQRTIREQFKHCTVLTIAHRLNTVMDSDRLLVLDGGRVAQFDSPSALLAADGIFRGMAIDAGLL